MVIGALSAARSLRLRILIILIGSCQICSSALAEDSLITEPTHLPVPFLENTTAWLEPSVGSEPSDTTLLQSSPRESLSPDRAFYNSSRFAINRGTPVGCSSATPDGSALRLMGSSCSQTNCSDIPWSRWDEGRSCLGFATHDFVTLARNLDNDFCSLWELENVAFVGAGLGLSLGLRGSVDEDVRDYTAQHPGRWGNFSDTLGVLGNTETQIAGMALLYGYAYHERDDELMDFTRLMIRSYSMAGLSTILIKGIANTDRPSDHWNNGQFGFPSAHVSTSFAIATTIEEYYGPQAGMPAYLAAGLIGWSRIDERDHDLSDVVFGAVLGYAIAKSIAGKELRGDSRIRMFPWTDPGNRTLGALWEIDF